MNSPTLTRRDLLRRCAAAGGLGLLGSAMSTASTLIPARAAIDHLLLGAADLDQGVAWLEGLTGVRAVAGGSHPGVGTRNALVSLGNRQYLEIIAPDPKQTTYGFAIDLRVLAQPRLITWAAASSDMGASVALARRAGYEVSAPTAGSRARPDGKLLQWKALRLPGAPGAKEVEPIPFFIEWAAGSVHPSQDSPKGCTLRSFEMEHPDPASVIHALEKLGIEVKVRPAKTARLLATLATPKGEVQLS
jgi:hypothetical protein